MVRDVAVMPFSWRTSLASCCLALAAGCQNASGSLQATARFPTPFAVAGIPATTVTIRLVVEGQGAFRRQATLTPITPTFLMAQVPVGNASVGAVAFDFAGKPLAGARTTAVIQPGLKATAVLDLSLDGLDADLLAAVAEVVTPTATPTPSPTPSPSPTPTPVPSPTPTPTPSPTGSPTPQSTPQPTATPTAESTPLPGGIGGGVLATPTPSPTPTPVPIPSASVLTGANVVPGNPYAGPVTVGP